MICVSLSTVKLVAAVEPKLTAVAPVKFVPVIVTVLAPPVGPAEGLTLETVGGGGRTRAAPCATACASPTSEIVIVVLRLPAVA